MELEINEKKSTGLGTRDMESQGAVKHRVLSEPFK